MDGGWRWRMEECSVRNWPSLGRPQWFTAGEQSFTTHEQTWITISCSGYAHTDAISRHRRASIIRHHYPSLHISLTVRCFHDDDGCDGKNLNQRHGGITQFATRLCTEKNWERQSGEPSTFHFNLTVRKLSTCAHGLKLFCNLFLPLQRYKIFQPHRSKLSASPKQPCSGTE